MNRRIAQRLASVGLRAVAACLMVLLVLPARSVAAPAKSASKTSKAASAPSPAYEFNDTHFHLTNYVQEGIDVRDFLKIMGTRVGRSALFGIPLQQQWSYRISGETAPTYYLDTDAKLYYYSFTDAWIAMQYRSLTQAEQARFDPMITGFNPTDMYAADHIRRVLLTFPGVFSGIGEFTIHKEFVSSKIAGDVASLTDPALDRIFDFAAETGMVVLIHSDIDRPFAKQGAPPVFLAQMQALFARHPKNLIIWAHTGLGRVIQPVEHHLAMLESMFTDPTYANLCVDISWDEVAKYAVSSPETIQRCAEFFNQYPDRFVFGTDTVSPRDPQAYYAVYDMWKPVFDQLTKEAKTKILKGNYERIFDQGRKNVRAWEQAHVAQR